MRPLAIAALLILLCSARCAEANEALAACRPHADAIHLAATENHVPVLLLTALFFSESSCDAKAVNKRTGARGLGQALQTGAGEGYTREELLDPVINAQVCARHLAKWRRRCGSWRGAVTVYHGNERCSAKSGYADEVIRLWKRLEKQQEVRS